jgi:hypothetical protein
MAKKILSQSSARPLSKVSDCTREPLWSTQLIGYSITGMLSASSLSQYSGRSRFAGSPFVQMMMSRVHVARFSAIPTAFRPDPITATF